MPVVEYTAYDSAGNTRRGVIEADSSRSARAKLKAQGLFLTGLAEAAAHRIHGQGLGASLRGIQLFQRASAQEMAAAVRQLATLLAAGLPLVGALAALREQVDN